MKFEKRYKRKNRAHSVKKNHFVYKVKTLITIVIYLWVITRKITNYLILLSKDGFPCKFLSDNKMALL